MSEPTRILEVAELDFALEPVRWAFAETRAASIAAHWAGLRKTKPTLFNGRVLLLRRRALETRADGATRFRGAFFETDYADFLAWRNFGHPGEPVDNCFSMAALRDAEGAFLLGEMAAHTYNAGQIYFPSGAPDPTDVFDGKVDLDACARRELLEETGVKPNEVAIRRSWTLVFALRRIACIKLMALDAPAEEAKARIDAFLARDPYAEFSRIHIVRNPRDIDDKRTPGFVAAFLRSAFA